MGKLNSKSQEQFEERYFLDDEIFAKLLVVYDRLLRSYHLNQLSGEDKQLFEQKYLSSQRGFQRAEFEKILMKNISETRRKLTLGKRLFAITKLVRHWLTDRASARVWRLATAAAVIVFVALLAYSWLFRSTIFKKSLLSEMSFVYVTSNSGLVGNEGRLKLRGMTTRSIESTLLILTEDDRYAIQIKPSSEIYLYVFQWDTSSNMALLFPTSEYRDFVNPLAPGKTYRIPPSRNWFVLDLTPGIETIGFGVATKPWEAMERNIDLFNKGSKQEKQIAIAKVKDLISEAEKRKHVEYHAGRFSFYHRLKGGKK
ncbi:DUF4384 domain-containing protein [Candidatus Bathyarchaeota archaeon]|nr:DUF4384 domain-containing protein [Candidatus Bathyarchaeota archaeon]